MVLLREGRRYTEKFLKLLPLLNAHWTAALRSIGDLLKCLQPATRLLHTLCNHYKTLKDATLVALIPPLKRNLEQLLYRVKELLETHKLGEHFTAKNLRLRTITGQELSTPSPIVCFVVVHAVCACCV